MRCCGAGLYGDDSRNGLSAFFGDGACVSYGLAQGWKSEDEAVGRGATGVGRVTVGSLSSSSLSAGVFVSSSG